MAVYLGLGALIVFMMAFPALFGKKHPIVGGMLLAGFLAMDYAAWGWFHFVFRCHERGGFTASGAGEQRLSYADITQFTYSATRHFHNGAYTGTQFSMKCAGPQANIGYSAMVNSPDEELDNLRDHIAKVIASRMFRQLQEGRTVAWTADMNFLPAGLQFRRATVFGMGGKPPEVPPYNQIRGVDLKTGVFYLWNQTESKPVITKPVSTPNFFPGYYLILALRQRSPRTILLAE